MWRWLASDHVEMEVFSVGAVVCLQLKRGWEIDGKRRKTCVATNVKRISPCFLHLLWEATGKTSFEDYYYYIIIIYLRKGELPMNNEEELLVHCNEKEHRHLWAYKKNRSSQKKQGIIKGTELWGAWKLLNIQKDYKHWQQQHKKKWI